jgi:hypothetical protein
MLIACQSTKTKTIAPTSVKYIPCEAIRAITYDSEKDTTLTVSEIRDFNAVYGALCK